MHKLIRFWYQNKNHIIKKLVIIIFVFIIIQFVNWMIRNKEKEKLDNIIQTSNSTKNESTENNKGVLSDKSLVTGNSVPKKQLNNSTEAIYQFVSYCNEQNFESAYNMITNECKEVIYSSLDTFKNAYYKNVFDGQKKNCTIENWVGDTYRVNYIEDILSIGKDTGYSKQDYITVKEIGNEYKLNINNYIGYSEIDKTTIQDDITIQIVSKNTFMEEEEYTIKVTNKKENSIQLDSINSIKTLYLEDSNGVEYPYYNHELTNEILNVSAGQTKEIKIKFYNSYVSTKKIKYMIFSNLSIKKEKMTETIDFRANI